MAVIFLDPDDEITTAISRLRASQDIKVALVLPPGSRLGTSRINFRLLAREAHDLPRQASIVTTEAGVRAIAVSAGLPAYASVAEYEAAVEAGVPATGAAMEPAVASAAVIPIMPAVEAPEEPGSDELITGTVVAAAAVAATSESATDRDPGIEAEATAASAAIAAPAAASKRSRARKVSEEPAAEVVAPTAAVPADLTPEAAPAAEAEAPTVVSETSALVEAGPPAVTTDEAQAAAASAFGAEVAGVPPPPRGPSPRSSAALPVVGGPVRSNRRFGGYGAFIGVLVVVALIGVLALAAAVIVLPQATITVAPPLITVGPVSRTVTADPTAIEADPGAGIIPAELVTIPLAAGGEFTATGVKVTETKARGSVTFTSYDTSAANTIPGGSVVATPDGVQFRTLKSIVVPAAKIKGPTKIDPGQASVRIEATKVGTGGNVAAGTVTRVPSGENGALLDVLNPSATSGGDRSESPRVSQEDVDVAVAELTKEIEGQMATALADPATAPAGLTLIEETATTGKLKASPAVANLVGKNIQTFKLALSGSGTVIAVDTGVLDPLAADALTAAVPKGAVLFPESVRTTIGTPTVDGGVVSFEVGATGQAWQPLDEAALLATVRGRSVLEAEDALAEYGKVAIDVWPFYVATIPQGDRATLTVVPPTLTVVPPAPSSSP